MNMSGGSARSTAPAVRPGSAGMPSDPYLATIHEDARRVILRTRHLTSKLTPAEMAWSASPTSWSIAQCIDHLIVTGDVYYPRGRAAIEEGRRRGQIAPSGTFRGTRFGRWFIYSAGPGARIRIKARPVFQPSANPAADVTERFTAQQETLLQLIRDAEGLDLRGIIITSPLSPFIKLTLGECLQMMVAHQERHILQANRISVARGGVE